MYGCLVGWLNSGATALMIWHHLLKVGNFHGTSLEHHFYSQTIKNKNKICPPASFSEKKSPEKHIINFFALLEKLQIFTGNLNAQDIPQGYDMYSSTIADVLSDPQLHTPMTLGLFAKWGSGKSVLINRLQGTLMVKKLEAKYCKGSFF